MKVLHMIAVILLVIGGVNWGLIGLGTLAGSDWDVINMILGSMPTVESVVYVLVGLSALWILVTHKKDCRTCSM